MLILVDDPESDGNLMMAAEKVTPEAINFMSTMGRGLICLALTGERTRQLDLPLMVTPSQHVRGMAFTVSMDARGIADGGSAYERAFTIRRASNPAATADDFVRPGHVFPLRARDGGILEREGHTEAAVELTRLAGLFPAGILCNVMAEDGTMARVPDLVQYARRHDLKICSVADLVSYVRSHRRPDLSRMGQAILPTRFGTFQSVAYADTLSHEVHLALVVGEVNAGLPVRVAVHSACTLGSAFGSTRCDCAGRLEAAMRELQSAGAGVLVYLGYEGRGMGLAGKIQAYGRQDQVLVPGLSSPEPGHPAEVCDFGPVAAILQELGVQQIRLIDEHAAAAMEEFGLGIVTQAG